MDLTIQQDLFSSGPCSKRRLFAFNIHWNIEWGSLSASIDCNWRLKIQIFWRFRRDRNWRLVKEILKWILRFQKTVGSIFKNAILCLICTSMGYNAFYKLIIALWTYYGSIDLSILNTKDLAMPFWRIVWVQKTVSGRFWCFSKLCGLTANSRNI